MEKIKVYSRSMRLMNSVRPRKARALLRIGQAVELPDGSLQYKHITDEEMPALQSELGYDTAHPNGRTWHSQQPAASGFRRCQVAGMIYA